MKKRSGFTLMEMLIVVAVIAVLVAIAIPLFTTQVASARTASCQANQRSLKASVSAAYMSNGLNRAAAAAAGVDSIGLSSGDLKDNDPVFTIDDCALCPEGGTYTITFKEGFVDVTCSQHYAFTLLGQDQVIMDSLGDELMKVGLCDSAGSYVGSAQITAKLIDALKSKGIDIAALGATSWAWRPDARYPKFYWSSVDIEDESMANAKGVPLMSYNPDSGKYMVYTGNVAPRNPDKANTYSTFNKVTDGLDYQTAYAKYLEPMKDYEK